MSAFINEEPVGNEKRKIQVNDKEVISTYMKIDEVQKNFQKIYQEEQGDSEEQVSQQFNLNPSMF